MRCRVRLFVTCAAIAAAGCANIQPPTVDQRSLSQPARLSTVARLLGSSEKDCTQLSNCPVVVTAEIQTSSAGVSNCLIRAGDVRMGRPTGQRKKIVWTVEPKAGSTVPPARFEFLHKGSGITILEPEYIGSIHKDITHGGHGDGSSTSLQQYHVFNEHTLDGDVHFFPVIQYRDVNGLPELCAAIDPKIINRP